MASVNKVILIGNLGKDPEVRTFPDGSAVANVSIACSESWKDKATGEKKESTEWVNLVFHRKLAEIVGQYLKKGSQVYVEGKLKTRKWQDKTTGQDKYTTEVICHEMTMLGSKGDNAGRSAPASNEAPANGGGTDDTDIPFASMGHFQH